MRKIFHPTYLFVFLFFWSSCSDQAAINTSNPWEGDRPHDPWVFRSVLDQQARMITLALDDELWVSYSTEHGALYKAWKGYVNFDGAVYTTAHGPQPTSIGNAYLLNKLSSPWVLIENGQERAVQSKYKGHRFVKGQVELMYEIDLGNGKVAKISERPEHLQSASGQNGFERVFTSSGLPGNSQLALKTKISSVALRDQIETNGELKEISAQTKESGKIKALDIDAQVLLLSNASTHLRTWFVQKPMIENPNKLEKEEQEENQDGYQLIARNDCKTCHNTYRKTIGPSYMEVARKYRNTPANSLLLVQKVKEGGTGIWGNQLMNAHPQLSTEEIQSMVDYILNLDAEEEAVMKEETTSDIAADLAPATADLKENELFPGVAIRAYSHDYSINKLAEINTKQAPSHSGIIPIVEARGSDFRGLKDDFGFMIKGYLNIPEDKIYEFALVSDDGSRLTIDEKIIIDHDGPHGNSRKKGKVALAKGYHPFEVAYFQGKGGKSLSFQWKKTGDTQFNLVPATMLAHHKSQKPRTGKPLAMASERKIAGHTIPLKKVHPSYDLSQARPEVFTPKVGGIDFLSDGRMVVSTWDAAGSVFLLSNLDAENPNDIEVKTIAKGFAEPLGLKVVEDEIYILQKQELTKLIDHDGDEIIDEYQSLCSAWKVSANFHEFAFGLAYKDGYFYGTLATAIEPGGASTQPQIPDRGKVMKISKADGSMTFLASGLRTPNGIGIGVDQEIFVADNQGDWLPASKIVHIRQDAWYGSRSVDPEGTANRKEDLPVVWLPQDEIGNSPSTPLALNDGPYKGQMIHGEVTHGGVKRVFVEKVDGEYQGCVFRFIQGLEAGVNRLCWGPDGALYAGGVGSTGNWGHTGKLWYGLQRLKYNEKPTFEILAVRAKSNGIELEMTEALRANEGWEPSDYLIKQWYYQPTANYGGSKLDYKELDIRTVNISPDRKKVFLELEGMKANHVIYVQLQGSPVSAAGNELLSSEAWYTMNRIPKNNPGFQSTPPAKLALNTLTEAEKAEGWISLFDGKTTNGWRNFKKETIGSSWIIDDDALMLDAREKEDGTWAAADGGDIITTGQYDNFELNLEWKIMNCGNSGIMYNVKEEGDYCCVWQTGPEMQVLDNSCHPDGKYKSHRAGDLYDMIECEEVAVLPAGSWNKVRLIVNNGKAEHWLNGRKLVSYTLWDDQWNEMVKGSKFKDMPDFGKFKKGHISLQDHNDKVWFRNIKIKDLSMVN